MHSKPLVAKLVISVVHERGLPVAPQRPCFLLQPSFFLPRPFGGTLLPLGESSLGLVFCSCCCGLWALAFGAFASL